MGVVPSRTSSLSARTVSRDLGHLRSRGSPGSSDPFVRTASASLGVVTGTEDVAGAGRGHACLDARRQAQLAPTPPHLLLPTFPLTRTNYLCAFVSHLFGRS
ncbi:hypothetical protein B296_00058703 [Ensete ventricosum]|uniref:Uncharacterized protein n=1 Tax=Ensete ventricosum TaxID=4639 RepID=A0A426WZ80_ENSVE|nr:hypothetical protein B296_00058703 [Ensete ventricosum]